MSASDLRERAINRFVAAWVAVAVALTVVVVLAAPPGPPSSPWWILAVAWVAILLAATSHVRFSWFRDIGESTTLFELAAVPALVLLRPLSAVAIVVTALLVAEFRRTPGEWRKITYNVAAQTASVTAASLIYTALTDAPFSAAPQQVLAATAAGFVLVLVNSASFVSLVAVVTGQPLGPVVREHAPDLFLLDAVIATTGLLACILLVRAPIGLPLLAAPGVLDQLRVRTRQRSFELAAAKQAAEAESRAKSDHLSRVTHELRTPLTAILGYGQLLQLSERLGAKEQELIAPILRSGQQLLELTDEILDADQVETGRVSVTIEAVPADDAVVDTISALRPFAERHDVDLRMEVPEGALSVLADRRRLRQVLTNLVSNAVKFNRAGGAAVVRLVPRSDAVTFEVIDAGRGLSSEQLGRLFTPFERLDAAAHGIPGNGLGLAISHHLVEIMGGELTATSEPGRGSTFRFTLPRAPGPDAHRGVPVEEAASLDGDPA